VTSPRLGINKELILAALQNGLSRNGDITRHVSEAAGRELSIQLIANHLRELRTRGLVVSKSHRWFLADPNKAD
jgi:DNA-binding HxlR family transcriptional regulator